LLRPGTPKEKKLVGSAYLQNYGLPQFFFHVTTAYAICATTASISASATTWDRTDRWRTGRAGPGRRRQFQRRFPSDQLALVPWLAFAGSGVKRFHDHHLTSERNVGLLLSL
jgi:aromatic ring-cleaving dioxygenase